MLNRKILNLFFFALLCACISMGFLYGETILKSFKKGPYIHYVLEDKPTVYVFFDENKTESNSYQYASQAIGSIGRQYEGKISLRIIPIQKDEANAMKEDFRLSFKILPALVILNDRGYIVGVYEGNFDLKSINFDLEQLSK